MYYRSGQMNLTGTVTEKDLSQAKDYLEKAAALDNADALYVSRQAVSEQRLTGY
jgi:TPR repeat protein